MRNKDIWNYFEIAKKFAEVPSNCTDHREYRHCALVIRGKDDVVVMARNGSIKYDPTTRRHHGAHAEYRVLSRSSKRSIMFVVRIGLSGEFRMSKPCSLCDAYIQSSGKIDTVYYTIGPNEFACKDYTKK